MGDSGCGPVAAATVLQRFGKGSVVDAARYALNGNYKETDGGTRPEFFRDYLGQNGISTTPVMDKASMAASIVSLLIM